MIATRYSALLCAAALVAAILLWSGCPALAGTVEVESTSAAPGSNASVCIHMNTNGDQIAGVQMDLNWDPGCLAANAGSSGQPLCRANPATGKNVQSAQQSSSRLRAIFFSMSDVNPIPDNMQLFCCSFTVNSFPSSSNCSVTLTNVIGSSPKGQQLSMIARPGVVQITGGGAAPGGASAPGAAPAAGPAGQAPSGGLGTGEGMPAPPGVQAAPGAAAASGAAVGGGAPAAPAVGGAPAPAEAPAAAGLGEVPAAPAPAQAPAQAPVEAPTIPAAGAPPAAAPTAEHAGGAPAAGAAAPAAPTAPAPSTPTPHPTAVPATSTPTVALPTSTPTTSRGFLGGCTMIRP